MGQRAGHEYGTERSRLRDGTVGRGFIKGSHPPPPCPKAIEEGFCKKTILRMVKLRKDLYEMGTSFTIMWICGSVRSPKPGPYITASCLKLQVMGGRTTLIRTRDIG